MRRAWAAVIAAALSALPAHAVRNLDWCAPIIVSADQTFRTGHTCWPTWTDDEIAQADMSYLVGNNATSTVAADAGKVYQDAYPVTCWDSLTGVTHSPTNGMDNAGLAGWIDRITARRNTSLPSEIHVLRERADLLFSRDLVRPGFDPAWLLTTTTPWSNVPLFFTSAGASWVDGNRWYGSSTACAYAGGSTSKKCLRELVNEAAGEDGATGTAYENKVYYINQRSIPVFWATAVLGDLSNSGYRAFKVSQYQADLTDSHATHVDLSHKLTHWAEHLYDSNGCNYGQHWLGSACNSNYAAVLATPFNLRGEWSAEPDGWDADRHVRYEKYVNGMVALASDLKAATSPAVPFVWLTGRTNFGTWDGSGSTVSDFTGNAWDDPATTTNEAEEIRRIALQYASIVLLAYDSEAQYAATAALVAPIEAGSGHPTVYLFNTASPCTQGEGIPRYWR